ncbi:MAG: extracellular solute-binding protein, partial [Ignavibacteriae bacterium]|nr:extracellular solute-binding protein [Ignavibacteriota bacterium]
MLYKVKQIWGFIFLLLISTLYLGIFLFGIAAKKNEVTEIYFADRITAAHKILIQKYNKLNEGKIKVVPIDFPNYDFNSNERKELLARSLRGRGDGIDLLAVDIIWVQRFAKWCEPLDKYFPINERSKILDYALESCYFNGELVAVPLNMVQSVLYYREDLLKKLPRGNELIKKVNESITWEDFINLKNGFNLTEPYYVFPAADYEGLICSFMELLLGLEPNYFETHGFNLNTPTAKKSLNLLVDIVNKDSVSPKIVTNFTEVPSYKYFVEKDLLFIRGWQSYDKDFLHSPFNPEKEKYLKKAEVPHFESGNKASVFGGWNIMMSKFSDKKDEVLDFMKFLLSESSQELFYTEAGYIPIINSFYEKEEFISKYPEIPELKKMQKIGVHRPANVEYTRYSKIISHYIELAIKNEISVNEALIKMSHEIQNEK